MTGWYGKAWVPQSAIRNQQSEIGKRSYRELNGLKRSKKCIPPGFQIPIANRLLPLTPTATTRFLVTCKAAQKRTDSG